MTMVEQVDRIDRNMAGELPPPVAIWLRFAGTVRPSEVLDRTRQVMRLIATSQRADWPSDDDWRRRLPDWFLRNFDSHTHEALLADPTLWDFGSWLDAMRKPGWEWWSSESNDQGGIVRCIAYSDPFAIEPLMYLLRAAGASEVEFHEE
jgi:hypothetical protein